MSTQHPEFHHTTTARHQQALFTEDLLRPCEVAAHLGVSRTWLYAAAKAGRIPAIRIGGPDGPLRFVPRDIERWLDDARAAWRPGDTSAATLRRLTGGEAKDGERQAA